MSRHRLLPLAAIAAATLALSACGSGTGSDPYGAVSAPVGGTPPPAAASPTATDPVGPLLAAKDEPKLGKIVADAEGFTLYRFDRDTAKPPTTTCVDACATKWPPVTVDPKGTLSLEGIEKGAIGMVQRPDGSTQLTLGGWPVYRFSGDTTPGATGGQGVGGTWFAITPEGKKAAATGGAAGGSGGSSSGSGGGAGASGSGASGSGGGSSSGSSGSSANGTGTGSSGGTGRSGAAADASGGY